MGIDELPNDYLNKISPVGTIFTSMFCMVVGCILLETCLFMDIC